MQCGEYNNNHNHNHNDNNKLCESQFSHKSQKLQKKLNIIIIQLWKKTVNNIITVKPGQAFPSLTN